MILKPNRNPAVRCSAWLGGRFDVFCRTVGCTWAGDWEDTSASRVENGQVVECDPNLFEAALCCPRCLLTNLVETDGWDDDQLPQRAFRPPNDKLTDRNAT